jgi:hypothetical protein
VKLDKIEGSRIDAGTNPDTVIFDVDVKMDEESRTNDELTVSFLLNINTKPSLVEFGVGGTATISGGRSAFDAALEVDEESKVPKVLHHIYQRAFTSLFVLSNLLETPYPPPDLIHAPSEVRDLRPEAQAAIDAAAQQAQQTQQTA